MNMQYSVVIFLSLFFLAAAAVPAEAQIFKREAPKTEAPAPAQAKAPFAGLKKKEDAPTPKGNDELKGTHKDAKHEFRAAKRERKAAEARENAARARAEAFKQQRKAIKSDNKADKADNRADKSRSKVQPSQRKN